MDVSICIATHRRPEGLARLLESLARAKRPPGLRAEVVLVDNDPATDPAHPAAEGVALPDLPLCRLREPRRSIAYARNCAVAAARGRWLAFVDDDEVVDEGWLAAYWRCVSERNADGFFGPVLPRLEGVCTSWLDPGLFFARPRPPSGARVEGEGARTGNALVRGALFRELAFDPTFGRSGGSDTLLFRQLALRGARFEWCDEAVVHESVPAERHRLGWLARRAFRGGCVHAKIERRLGRGPSRLLGLARAGAAAGLLLAAAGVALPTGRVTSARALLRALGLLGQGWAHLGGGFIVYGD